MEFTNSFEYKNKKYTLAFTLNVMESIQDEYGSLKKWEDATAGVDGEPNIKAIKFGIKQMLNEGIEIENEETGGNRAKLTDTQVGRLITAIGFEEMTGAVKSTVYSSTKNEEKNV